MPVLANVLTPEELSQVIGLTQRMAFEDGKSTARGAAASVKNNQQAALTDPHLPDATRIVLAAIQRHPLCGALIRPRSFSRVLFSRYSDGQEYGFHTDAPLRANGPGQHQRTDLSFTLFLADPTTYDGGALIIRTLEGDRSIKLPAGSAVVYATGELHRVEPVTRGERLASVGWIQSYISDPHKRALLYDLEVVRTKLTDAQARLAQGKAIGNLVRMWAQN